MKDYQVKQIYKAEEEWPLFNNGQLLSKDEITEFVTQISIWADIKIPKIICKDEYHVTDVARGWKTKIFLPVFAQNPWYICHEMSHVILYNWKNVKNDHHGPNFCYIYLKLVAWVLGTQFRKELRKLFVKNEVQISNNLV